MFQGISFFIRYSFRNKKSYLLCRLAVEIVRISISLTAVIAPKYVLDELFGAQRMEYLVLWVGILLGVPLLGGWAESVLKMCADNAREELRSQFEIYIMENQMQCDFAQMENPRFHDLKSKAGQYINGQWNQFGVVCERAFSLFGHVFTLLGVLYLIVRIHVVVLLIFAVMTVVNTWLGARLKNKTTQLMRGFAPVLRRRGYYEDVTKNPAFAKEIRLGGITDWLLGKYDHYMQQFCLETVPIHRHNLQQKTVTAATGFLQQAVTYGYLFWQAAARAITLGDFTMYLNAMKTFNNVINNTVDTVLEIVKYTAFYKDFEEFDNFPRQMRTGTMDAGEVLAQAGKDSELEFRNVSFRYPGQAKDAVKKLSVKIPLGQKISIVGENGAGKTTFIKLLTRLYDPTEGQILLNGVDIRELEYESYMKLFAVVPQDFQLLKGTIRENICMSRTGDMAGVSAQGGGCNVDAKRTIGDRRNVDAKHTPDDGYNADAKRTQGDEHIINEALAVTGLGEKIRKLEKGLDTQVYKDFDPNGIELSGGEAQKLVICRAYYKDAPVCVLDEPTAALDPRAEYEIYENFHTLVRGKTALFISHRLASSRVCDRVMVFRGGEIAEDGSHQELMERGGLYSELFAMQAQFFEG